ncbi:FAD-dependent oxidoreductase [Photobacterium sanguinicancri]|uniref:FAD-dependent oxidoreductase n=1 Tax=Photobacterium sanguinicancri TaxID=875932 RepID=UPI0026E35AAF|nr:FAD-dependent oxidoreductase [Photobacterium sanguinicancri]MDO6497511.1 FAD-dependent oxidoreductase [Photobacterium sanguinicancri]
MSTAAENKHIAVLGAGPAGLMAAWELMEAGYQVTILDRDDHVGGMCATQTFTGQHGDYRFDFGGHRFITKNPKLLAFVDSLMGEELLFAQRKSVIRYRGRIYQYPLALVDLIKNAPLPLLVGGAVDLAKQIFKPKPQDQSSVSFAEWIESRFGTTLYKHFFEGYTGKLWGIDPKFLSGDWASQRISLMDLKDVARRLLPGRRSSVRTYARQYRYPKLGFGQLYTRLAEELEKKGVTIVLNSDVCGLTVDANQLIEHVEYRHQGETNVLSCDQVISTLPLPLMCQLTGFDSGLEFRSLRFMNMPMETQDISDNTWQYLSDPELLGTRLQEPKRRSSFMAPEGRSSVMIEIPCNKNDDVWNMDGDRLQQRVLADLASLGVDPQLATGEYFTSYTEHAYPLMDMTYQAKREKAITHLSQYSNLIMTGRQGTFRYIFTDTAMEMGMMAAQSVIDGKDRRREIFDFRNEKTVIEVQSVA